jgi:hypothetical protein
VSEGKNRLARAISGQDVRTRRRAGIQNLRFLTEIIQIADFVRVAMIFRPASTIKSDISIIKTPVEMIDGDASTVEAGASLIEGDAAIIEAGASIV